MIKLIVKLAIAALIIHAAYRSGMVFLRYYNFKDEVRTTAQFAGNRGEADITSRVLEIANKLEVPLADDHLTVKKQDLHTTVNATYSEQIEVFPNYFYPWEFHVNVDVLTMTP